MIKSEDVFEFDDIMIQMRRLLDKIHKYNPQAKICFNAICDENEEDDCGIFLIDDSVLDPKSLDYLESGDRYKDFIGRGFAAGYKIEGAEMYSRGEISRMIKEYEENY